MPRMPKLKRSQTVGDLAVVWSRAIEELKGTFWIAWNSRFALCSHQLHPIQVVSAATHPCCPCDSLSDTVRGD